MRIKAIRLAWFRGAGDTVTLDLNSKSMVVYGPNGAGKSSFVDAVEYILNEGKICHLSHEYSGRRQERAVPNTHRPQDRKTELAILFQNGAELKVDIRNDGTFTMDGAEAVDMPTWDYRRTVLRQDEVAAFISDSKGHKYSALLPLLGLHHLEVAAENLRQLGRSVGEQSRLSEIGAALKQAKDLRTAAFGADSEEQIQSQIDVLHATYCADKSTTTDPLAQCNELTQALNARIADSSADLRRHVTLKDSASLNLQAHVDSVRVANGQLAVAFEPLVAEKLEVLRFARGFADKLVVGEKEVHCPACGQAIQVEGFKEHIRAERERLSGLIVTFETRRAAIATLCDTLKSLKANLARNDVTSWRDELATGPLAEHLTYLDLFDAEGLRNSCNEDDLKAIEVKLLPLIDAAASASADAPPGAEQLSDDRQTVESGRAMIEATGQTRTLDRASVVSRKQLYSV